ncbi:GNAT family N-acetyltransferase [Pseudonocardiaceae bacterium YIM PH 21723]|nr:GNAT family N-acetyltransferase [Pseudonocardiaceae bacterium YIM PH 21723]
MCDLLLAWLGECSGYSPFRVQRHTAHGEVTGTTVDDEGTVLTEHSARLGSVDALIPPQLPLPADQSRILAERDGRLVGLAVPAVEKIPADSLDRGFTSAVQYRLRVRVGVDHPKDAMRDLLDQWIPTVESEVRDHGDPADTELFLRWPSRDIHMTPVFLDHGLLPVTVLAVGVLKEQGHPSVPADLELRLAGAGDLDFVHRMYLAERKFSEQFPGTIARPETEGLLREHLATRLADGDLWAWIAIRDGEPVGLVAVSPPSDTRLAKPLVSLRPNTYLECCCVVPGERGAGLGKLLVRLAHHKLGMEGVRAVMLHYNLMNPLSVPFWSSLGYRPLWTHWQRRPVLKTP